MLPRYDDIRALTAAEPMWFTEDGVPRFAPFAPTMLGVYDNFALLAAVRCQSCSQVTPVGAGITRFVFHVIADHQINVDEYTVERFVNEWTMGDPPHHNCPGAGETMTADTVGLIEVWQRPHFEWERRADLERAFAEEDFG